ncbi:MAG: biotin transporter BioY [Clostridia bacterium]|nr:biotin transporter BioY [Clostridia bacterium]
MKPHNHRIRTLVQCALFAALLVISAWIQIPGAVPFTLQTMAVCVTAGVLGTAKGMASLLIYLGLGTIGLPVFSGFSGGIGALFGATGGFIMGFVLTVTVIGVGKRLFGRSKPALTLSMVLGVALCYVAGALWFAAVYAARGEALSVSAVLSACVLPFLLPECVKIATAVAITLRLWKIVER